jgi:hypothetical protein
MFPCGGGLIGRDRAVNLLSATADCFRTKSDELSDREVPGGAEVK